MVQLRGEKLKILIKEGITKLAISYGTKKYVYNASELSELIKVSRPTLSRYAEYIDEVLKENAADKKVTKGTALIEIMREKIARLEKEKALLKKDLDTLRNHHAKIYDFLYGRSIDMAPLVKKIVLEESIAAGHCILCNQAIDETKLSKGGSKIVRLTGKKASKEK